MAFIKKITLSILLLCIYEILGFSDEYEEKSVKIQPLQYNLTFTTSEAHYKDGKDENMKFFGETTIQVMKTSNKNTSFDVTLNADSKMKILSAELKGDNSNKITGQHVDSKITFKCTADFNQKFDSFFITVKYEGLFGNDMTGFYRSSYPGPDKKNRWLLTTHFEPIFARKAFPCFDKPDLKAKFQVNVVVPKSLTNYHTLSNTPCQKKPFNATFDVFNCANTETQMSTYLVAFTVSDFKATKELIFESDYNSAKFTKNRKLKTWGREEIVDKEGELSLTAGKDALTELTNYLKIGYAFEKMDQIGIPDFSAGAMENWGLISYREKILFFNDKTGSTLTKQGNVLTVTHELIHQWFGNLVTLETWDYIWLNEAFACYLQYVLANKIKNPNTSSWDYLKQQVVNEIHLRAFETDGLNSSKALSHKIEDESLIFSYFNDIPYSKGSAVLRMWDLSLGNGKFQESLQEYMKTKKEQAANPNDLYQAFKIVTNMSKEYFDLWTEKPGYPVVDVTKESGKYVLTQSRFLWEKPNNPIQTEWVVPITFLTSDNRSSENPVCWLSKENKKCVIQASGKWIIINKEQAGYYRVNYEKNNWEALATALKDKHEAIPELNRAQIINDIFSLARSLQKKYVDYSTALQLSQYLKKETKLIPWKTALSSFDFLRTKLYTDEKIYPNFKVLILNLLSPHFNNFNVTSLNHPEILKSIEISRWACSLEFEPCIKKANEMYKNNIVSPDFEEIILCTVIKNNDEVFNKTFELYQKETDSSKKVMYLSALGCSTNTSLIKEYLEKTLSDKPGIRKQDTIYVLQSVYNGNLKNVKVAFDFVIKNYNRISQMYGGINPLGRAVVGIAKKLNSLNDLEALKKLAESIKNTTEAKPAIESIESAISITTSNIYWMKEKKSQFDDYFNSGSLAKVSFTLISLCLFFISKV